MRSSHPAHELGGNSLEPVLRLWSAEGGGWFSLQRRVLPGLKAASTGMEPSSLGDFSGGIRGYRALLHLKKTVWGFEVNVIGSNETAARAAGMKIKKNIILVLFLAGGVWPE